jgi:hypothetical protein
VTPYFGVCQKELEHVNDKGGAQCWFPHPPAPSGPVDADLALQCQIGFSQRVVTRCREIFGPSAVVATARADLTRNSDVVVLVRAAGGGAGDGDDGGGPAAAARRLAAEDVHMLAQLKRVYVTSARGMTTGFDTCTRAGGARGAGGGGGGGAGVTGGGGVAAANVAAETPELLVEALTEQLKVVLAAAAGGASPPIFELCYNGRDATHSLDVVSVR